MKTPTNRAFVILYAVLLVSIVLAVSLSLFNITYKQIILSNLIRDSQLASYAALSGLDCADYNNTKNSDTPFGYWEFGGTPSAPSYTLRVPSPEVPTITCLPGVSPNPNNLTHVSGSNVYTTSFDVDFNNSGRAACSKVVVTKDLAANGSPETTIEASGYNVSCANATNPTFDNRKVERKFVRTTVE